MATKRKNPFVSVRVALAASAALFLVWTTNATAGPPPHAGPPQHAGPPLQGNGTGQITDVEITILRETGGNSHQARTLTGIVQGTLEGTFVQEVTGTVHPNGQVTFGGIMEFTGTVDGCGNGVRFITLGLSGRGRGGDDPITEATVRVIRQPANTLHATGHGVVTQKGPLLTYELEYKCR